MVTANKNNKAAKIIGNVVFWVVLGLVILYSGVSLLSNQDSNKFTIFGVETLAVQSNSMANTFRKGDLIFINTDVNVDSLEEGAVITYRMQVQQNGTLVTIYNTHRIYDISDDRLWFYTRGDNNSQPDPGAVVANDIVGQWTGGRLIGIGGFVDFLKSSLGFFLFIVLSCFAFLVYEIVRFIKIISEYNVQKALGDRVKMQEEAVAMARAQLEAEMKAKLEAEKKTE